jgi:hypothetical protein
MSMLSIIVGAVIMLLGVIVGAALSSHGKQGPQGPPGPMGPKGDRGGNFDYE